VGPELANIQHPLRLELSSFVEAPNNPSEICIFTSADVSLCNLLATNVSQLMPAFVYPDLTVPPKPKPEPVEGAGAVASAAAAAAAAAAYSVKDIAAVTGILAPAAVGAKPVDSLQLSVLRDEFCMHMLKSSHRGGGGHGTSTSTSSGGSGSSTAAAASVATLNKALARVFLRRFESE
jgi:hypothetical protein